MKVLGNVHDRSAQTWGGHTLVRWDPWGNLGAQEHYICISATKEQKMGLEGICEGPWKFLLDAEDRTALDAQRPDKRVLLWTGEAKVRSTYLPNYILWHFKQVLQCASSASNLLPVDSDFWGRASMIDGCRGLACTLSRSSTRGFIRQSNWKVRIVWVCRWTLLDMWHDKFVGLGQGWEYSFVARLIRPRDV